MNVKTFFLILPAMLMVCNPKYIIPVNPYPKLTGPYPIGTHDYFWIDVNRDEVFTSDPNDKRHLMVQTWYPSEKVAAETYPLINNLKQYSDTLVQDYYSHYLHIKTNAVLDAPISGAQSRYPVLIYNHGAMQVRNGSTFQIEMLANHGYVVFSAEHTGLCLTDAFPDGYTFKQDVHFYPKSTGKMFEDDKALDKWLYNLPIKNWVGDNAFILDQLEALNNDEGSIFYNRLDLQRIGIFGWSYGADASLHSAMDDKRVKAVLFCDGRIPDKIAQAGIGVPVMLMRNGGARKNPLKGQKLIDLERLKKTWKENEVSFWAHTKTDGYSLKIKKSGHGNFSDSPLYKHVRPNFIDRHLAHEIINAYTLSFFDRYLKGSQGALLDQIPSDYKEVEFKKIKR